MVFKLCPLSRLLKLFQVQSLKRRLDDITSRISDSPEQSRSPSPLSRANQSTPQRATRSSLAGQKTALREATNRELRRSPRLKGKATPEKSSRKRSLDASPSTSTKRRLVNDIAESSGSSETQTCMINTATGRYTFNIFSESRMKYSCSSM